MIEKYEHTRNLSIKLIRNLSAEDTVIQPSTDVSPPKWHLAHTTWFFENFILKKFISNYKSFNDHYDFLFNSYYESQGNRSKRNMRGFHSRPLLNEILEYRESIDLKVKFLLKENNSEDFLNLIQLGIQHEQQHQELLLTDLKNIWSFSPLHPIYSESKSVRQSKPSSLTWLSLDEGLYEIGNDGIEFHFDNESPRHKIFLGSFQIASRPVLNGEFIEFIESGGYENWIFWMHEGWQWLQENQVKAPLYWEKKEERWFYFTLNGFCEVEANEILTHISFYEADAFARWKDLRLPTEGEWELAASKYLVENEESNFLDNENFHPVIKDENSFLGQVWEWTNSAYLPYPKFKPWSGGIGEYNGKFMINQMVLKGGSCITPKSHIRVSYRNFFHPWLRFQFTGLRLARDS